MKTYFPSIIVGGLILTLILQGIIFADTNIQFQKLQKEIKNISEKLIILQTDTDRMTASLIKLNNETTASDIVKQQTNQAFLAETDPNGVLSNANVSQTLGIQSTTETKLRLKSGWNNIDIYESAKPSSRIIAQIINNQDYLVIEKQPNWYKIKLTNLSEGWVQSQFVYETN